MRMPKGACGGEVGRVGPQDLPGDGAGVLGVGVDIALRQRQPERRGAAEVVATGCGPGAAGQLCAHLREDQRLGELLRPDHHRAVYRPVTSGQDDRGQHGPQDRGTPHAGTSGPRWAWTNRVTNASAG